VDVVNVLLGFDRRARWLTKDGAQFGGCHLPLGTRQTFRTDDELAFGRYP
jgi:hypothetical protein